MEFKSISFSKEENRIGILTLERPNVLNALNNETLDEVEALLVEIGGEGALRGLIITGKGRAFAAGADLSEVAGDGIEENRRYAGRVQNIFNQIEALPYPVVAAVNGYAMGGGCELALACDIRIAGQQAKFGMPEVGLGMIPCFGGTQRLTDLIGRGLAKELIFSGRTVMPQEALAIGLVNRIVPQEELMEQARELLRLMCAKSGSAIKYAKLAIDRGRDMCMRDGMELERELSAICYGLPDKVEGARAFLEKRTPVFPGNKNWKTERGD